MAQIEGLKEQQEALKRVKHNLKEIEDINKFLKGVSGFPKDENTQTSHSVSITFTVGDDMKRFKCPLLVDDNRFILKAAQKYKESIVAKVKKDSDDFRIALSPKETATLEWTLTLE